MMRNKRLGMMLEQLPDYVSRGEVSGMGGLFYGAHLLQ